MIPLGVLAQRQAAAGGPLAAAYTDHGENGSGFSSYTFAARAIGTPAASRRITVAVAWRSAGLPTLTAVTIGGVSASVHVTHTNDAGGNRTAITWATAHVPTGSTADVVVTFSTTIARCAVSLWSLTDAPTLSGSAASVSSNGSMSPTGGDVILAAALASPVSTGVATWTGATERHETLVGSQGHTAADAAAGTTVSVLYSLGWNASSLASAIALGA